MDNTTTINRDQLNVDALLSENMKIDTSGDGPQILIYHTHSQEGYKDSKAGDAKTSVIGVGDRLTELLEEKGNVAFYNLISAGKNWFEAKGACEVILSGAPEIDFWKQLPNSREAIIETLELTDLPKRPDRTTRLRITATSVSDDKIEIEIKDLGFGEFFRATDKIWRHTMVM